jgi:hypothetical protein
MVTPLSGLATPLGHCSAPPRRLNDEEEKYGAFARALPDADCAAHLRVPLANHDHGLGPELEPHQNFN